MPDITITLTVRVPTEVNTDEVRWFATDRDGQMFGYTYGKPTWNKKKGEFQPAPGGTVEYVEILDAEKHIYDMAEEAD